MATMSLTSDMSELNNLLLKLFIILLKTLFYITSMTLWLISTVSHIRRKRMHIFKNQYRF